MSLLLTPLHNGMKKGRSSFHEDSDRYRVQERAC
jgi:hypothetical protein